MVGCRLALRFGGLAAAVPALRAAAVRAVRRPYPLFKGFCGAAEPRLVVGLQLAFFNLALTAILAVGLYLLGLEDFFGFTLVVYGAGNALFVLYDVALTRLISVYYKRFRR